MKPNIYFEPFIRTDIGFSGLRPTLALACKHAHYGTVPTPGGRKCEPGTNSSDMRLGISKQAKRHQDNKQENHEKRNHTEPRTKDRTDQKQISTSKPSKTKNFRHQKETTRVLHPAPRLTPENGGIPPFYRVC